MRSKGRDEPTPEEMLLAVDRELGLVRAILTAVERAPEVLEVVAACEDLDEAVAQLQSLLEVDEVGARAMMNVEFRRMTGEQQRGIRGRVLELEAERDRLQEPPGATPSP